MGLPDRNAYEIHKLAGEPLNPGSPKQLGEILFGKMKLPGGEKTKTGQWATGARALEDLAEQAVDDIVEIDGLDEQRAATLIMEARKPWFAEQA